MATASRARTCDRDGCGRPHRARGLCSTHYNQDHQPDRHGKVDMPCAWCGKICQKAPTRTKRYAELFCSLACRDHRRRERESTRTYQAVLKARKAAAGTSGTLWTAGTCHVCRKPFVGWGAAARYCNARCTRTALNRRKKAAHRARRALVRRVPYIPRDVYMRDGWRCHLCGRAVRRDVHYLHPLAPTIDHLVPISRGGEDTSTNVRCAHRTCNTKRGVGGTVQLLLIG